MQQGFLSYLRRYYEEDAGQLEEPAAVIDGAAAKAHYSEELRRPQEGVQSNRFGSEIAHGVASP